MTNIHNLDYDIILYMYALTSDRAFKRKADPDHKHDWNWLSQLQNRNIMVDYFVQNGQRIDLRKRLESHEARVESYITEFVSIDAFLTRKIGHNLHGDKPG